MNQKRWLGEVVGVDEEGREVIKRMFVTENIEAEVDDVGSGDEVKFYELDEHGRVKREKKEDVK